MACFQRKFFFKNLCYTHPPESYDWNLLRMRLLILFSRWGQGMTGPSQWKDAGVVHESLSNVMMVCPRFLSMYAELKLSKFHEV